MQVGQKLGPFIIEKVLGSGAMGAVYRARYVKTNAKVAIKIVGAGLTANELILARFDREAKILKQLDHPNIVKFFGSGRTEGAPWYAMEYVEGESLDQVLDRRQRYTWEEVVAIGQQLCDALQHAHTRGIIHRDVKPSNLMILPDDTVKLTDFGIAKDTDVTALTAANCTVGTASYMSPEQCKGQRDLTFKSDLYSLGIVLFELLTGRKPFIAETPMDMFLLHIGAVPPRVTAFTHECPMPLDVLIQGLLEKEPEKRPRDAAMVEQILTKITQDVIDRKSAGEAAAKRRAIDRPRNMGKLDEDDKDAARALRGVKAKKPKKKKTGPPFYTRIWFTIPAVMLVVGLLGTAIFMVTRPPSVESLYAEAKPLMDSPDVAKWAKAIDRDGPLDRFQRYHSLTEGELADKMRKWVDKANMSYCIHLLDRMLEAQKASKPAPKPDNDIQSLALKAATAEDDGFLNDAQKAWQELKTNHKADGSDRPWVLIAEDRLKNLASVGSEEARIRDKITKEYPVFGGYLSNNELEKQVAEAIKLEMDGKTTDVRSAWDKLKDKLETEPAARVWLLLALKKLRDLPREKP